MDISSIIQRFLDDKGQVSIPPGFTLPAMTEMLYQAGEKDNVNVRFWDLSLIHI